MKKKQWSLAPCLLLILGAAPSWGSPTPTESDSAPVVLEVVRVEGERQAGSDTTARLTLQDLGVQRVEDGLALVPSAQAEVGNGGLSTGVRLRGFVIDAPLIDGLPDLRRLFVRDLSTVAGVALMPGGQGIVYGLSSPGGALNYQLQRAGRGQRQLRLGLDEQLQRRVVLDWDPKALAADGLDWALRAVLASQRGRIEPAQLPQNRHNIYLNPVLQLGRGHRLALQLEAQQEERPFAFGTVLRNGRATTPQRAQPVWDRLYVLPGGGPSERHYTRAALHWEWGAAQGWSAWVGLQRGGASRDETLVGHWALLNERQLSGYYTEFHDSYRQLNARARLAWADSEQRFELGADSQRAEFSLRGKQNIAGYRVLIDAPDFDAVDLERLPTTTRFNHERQKERGLWVLAQRRFGPQWQASAGLRWQRYRVAADRVGAGLLTAAVDEGMVKQLGLQWQAPQAPWRAGWQLGESLQPNRGQDRQGHFLPSQTVRSQEVWARWQPSAGALLQAGLYRTQLRHLAMRDPQDRNALISAGARQAQGLELQAQWQEGPWRLRAQASWMDMRQLQRTSASLGDDFVGAARRLGGLSVERRLPDGVQLSAQGRCVGPRFADATNRIEVAGHCLLDLALNAPLVSLGGVMQLAVRNVTDQRHLVAMTAVDDVYQGPRRGLNLAYVREF
ncbi:outer membrane receptor protein involved in Fe transport [Inhella inkyongensis]|uniref:Outer membrane receptor protein involved in Fe transport n=1 Tax=Inhella inkyongensis TaxID=392593 RepID=A0A840SAI0_9BURK|nr:TonB-dependent receptor [Inhella inkyongensis]MBB5205794.1 outer membrane receptor protein involved in Fe transport [Inhella inkyongensis]